MTSIFQGQHGCNATAHVFAELQPKQASYVPDSQACNPRDVKDELYEPMLCTGKLHGEKNVLFSVVYLLLVMTDYTSPVTTLASHTFHTKIKHQCLMVCAENNVSCTLLLVGLFQTHLLLADVNAPCCHIVGITCCICFLVCTKSMTVLTCPVLAGFSCNMCSS